MSKTENQTMYSKNNKMVDFLRREQNLWFWSIILLLVLFAVKAPFSGSVIEFKALRVFFGGILTLVLPGYSFVRILYTEKQIDPPERYALSLGLSLAITPIIGFLLNFTPWGIQFNTLVLCLSFFIVVSATIGLYREYVIDET